jgi:hypothetical protein
MPTIAKDQISEYHKVQHLSQTNMQPLVYKVSMASVYLNVKTGCRLDELKAPRGLLLLQLRHLVPSANLGFVS